MDRTIFTVGHSNHSLNKFLSLLKQHDITALCDVRSKPYSRMNPQFNRETLKDNLSKEGIAYVFLGLELGGRCEDPSIYDQGKIQYDRLAETKLFSKGIKRVQEGTKQYRVALMCAEKEPLECHRTILVSRYLEAQGFVIQHIQADGKLESHSDALSRLIRKLKLPEQDMFLSQKDIINNA
ncbi:MAG: DUF488 family protein, partial [Nitrospinaceae bacterium]